MRIVKLSEKNTKVENKVNFAALSATVDSEGLWVRSKCLVLPREGVVRHRDAIEALGTKRVLLEAPLEIFKLSLILTGW